MKHETVGRQRTRISRVRKLEWLLMAVIAAGTGWLAVKGLPTDDYANNLSSQIDHCRETGCRVSTAVN